MILSRHAALACVLLAPLARAAAGQEAPLAAQAPEPWGLADCIRYAVEHSPRLHAERHRLRAAREAVAEARAGDDARTVVQGTGAAQAPELSITLPEDRVVRVSPATQASLSISTVLPLDVSHYWRYRRDGATESASAQAEQLRQAAEQLVLDTITGYYRVLMAAAGLDAAREAVGVAEAELARTRARLAAGVATPALLAVAESALTDARTKLTALELAFADANAFLATTLGLPTEQAPPLLDAPLELDTSTPWEEARDLALQERPELAGLVHSAAALGATAQAIRASTKPSLSLSAGGGLNTPGSLASPTRSLRAGLAFSWPLGGNGSARAQARSAEERREAVLQDLEQTRLLVETKVYTAISRLEEVAATLEADRSALAEAEALALQTRLRHEAGVATAQEVAARACAVSAARARLHADECDQSLARAEWARALGILSRLAFGPPAHTREVQP